jgi:hypothetical protein
MFENIDYFKGALATILNKNYMLWKLVNSFKIMKKGKYFTLNSLSNHFSTFENKNYHRLVISLQVNNLTSLYLYATDLTSDRSKRIICILSLINCKLAWLFLP